MSHWIATAWRTYVAHPMHGNGYQWWSGAGSDLGEATLLGFCVSVLRRHTCHVHRCWRLQWHPDPVSGHPVCKKHHPDHPKGQNVSV